MSHCSKSQSQPEADDNVDEVKKNWRPIATKYDPIKVGSLNGIGTEAHDKGVIRALTSKYFPPEPEPPAPKKDDSKKIFVGKLDHLICEPEVERAFSNFGDIVSVKLIRDVVTKESKGYCFIEFRKQSGADRAYRKGDNIVLGGNTLIVDRVHCRSMPGWKPRRLGGGFGGDRNSGQMRFGCRSKPWLRPLFDSERKQRQRGEKRKTRG